MNRDAFITNHPGFPWLTTESVDAVSDLCITQGWLRNSERILQISRAGEGNMNLVLRLKTNQRSLILKQSRPWVEKYDQIPAPWDRIEAETGYYQRTAGIPAVHRRSPEILGYSDRAKAIIMTDMAPCNDYTALYTTNDVLSDTVVNSLADYMAKLHTQTMGDPDLPTNMQMRQLNHEHIFVLPLKAGNGLELDTFEPGLRRMADRLATNKAYKALVEKMGHRYLQEGPCLCHGDSFPGSWLDTPNGLVIIDPEFCLPGDPEFDIGFTLAHLALCQQPLHIAEKLIAEYKRLKSPALSSELIAGYAVCEIMRRIIGVAQLPIPHTKGWRAQMLDRTLAAQQDMQWKKLWPTD